MKMHYQILIGIYKDGNKIFMGLTSPLSNLPLILSHFPKLSELQWYKTEVLKAKEKQLRTYAGQNSYICYITGEDAEIGYYNFEEEREVLSMVSTQNMLDFIDEAITFIEFYESGGIPGIIPESKLDSWVKVPKEFVKDEWWDKNDKSKKQ